MLVEQNALRKKQISHIDHFGGEGKTRRVDGSGKKRWCATREGSLKLAYPMLPDLLFHQSKLCVLPAASLHHNSLHGSSSLADMLSATSARTIKTAREGRVIRAVGSDCDARGCSGTGDSGGGGGGGARGRVGAGRGFSVRCGASDTSV
jgi:hypothetical protein